MADWSWVIGPGASSGDPSPDRELGRDATGRVLTRRLRAASTAQFTVDARSAAALEIVDKVSDLWIWRDGVEMFRGRITIPDDTVSAKHSTTYTATCYRGMMSTRTVGAADVSVTGEQAAIVWGLIAATQARPGGDWGIVPGLVPEGGPIRERNWPAGKSLADAIDELADVDDGFEWEISPDMRLNVWSPRRGSDDPVVLDYGGVVGQVRVTGDPTRFGNVVIATGSKETTPVVAEIPGITSDPRGRWELVDSSPTVVLQSTLVERAPARLVQALTDGVALSAQIATGTDAGPRWSGPDDLWLGDAVRLVVNSGRLGEFDARAHEITLVPGDDGVETVTVGLTPGTRSTLAGAIASQRNDVRRRLRALELAAARPTP